MFPEGKSVDPWKAPEPTPVITFEIPPVRLETKVGLYTKTFPPLYCAKMTFPPGASTPDSHVPVAPIGPTFENPVAKRE